LWILAPGARTVFQNLFFEHTGPEIDQGLRRVLLQTLGVWLLATLMLQARHLRPRSRLAWALSGVVLFDLWIAGRSLNPTAAPEMITGVPPAAALVRKNLGDGRFYRTPIPDRVALSLPSNDAIWLSRWNLEILNSCLATTYGVPVIYHDDVTTLAPLRLMKLKWAAESAPWPKRLPLLSAAAVRIFMTEEELDLPGVELLAAFETGAGSRSYVYRNARAAERAELATVTYRARSADDALAAMLGPGFDPRRHAVLEEEAPAPATDCHARAEILVREAATLRRRLSVATECPGALVFSELFYPGWQAWVDGQRAPLLRANVAFSAVWLEPGEHEVEWRYVPRIFELGLAVSGLTLAVLLLGWWRRIRRTPRPRRPCD
jgi:hypothetical protein